MGIEIERKFLVIGEPNGAGPARALRQAYVTIEDDRTVRVRLAGDQATLTVKAGRGVSRTEVEVGIPMDDFEQLWALAADRSVVKTRTRIPLDGGLVAELDVFGGRHEGLRLVEVEFPSEAEAEAFVPPPWFGEDVTHEGWATNASLAVHGLPAR
jgi:CYTH domain-containing protein